MTPKSWKCVWNNRIKDIPKGHSLGPDDVHNFSHSRNVVGAKQSHYIAHFPGFVVNVLLSA